MPEAGERRHALVDAHVQRQHAAPLELGGDEGDRLGARAGAQDDVADALLDEGSQESCGSVGRGRWSGARRRRTARPRAGCALAVGLRIHGSAGDAALTAGVVVGFGSWGVSRRLGGGGLGGRLHGGGGRAPASG